eukprot:10346721-Ditylum_brightwellii.AAC.1
MGGCQHDKGNNARPCFSAGSRQQRPPPKNFTHIIVQQGLEEQNKPKEGTMPNPMASSIGQSRSGLWAMVE